MEPVVLAIASDERYFPGLYCVVASALSQLGAARSIELKVLDGGLSHASRGTLSRLTQRFGEHVALEFVTVDASIFHKATLGPGKSYMAYCRILLPQLLDVPRLIYFDSDLLVFCDFSELFDLPLSRGKLLAAVPDAQTLTLGDDSRTIADAMNLPDNGRYFNSGVMLLDLNGLRNENFTQQSLGFFSEWRGCYKFWDQSAINFLLHGQIEELPEHWNRASWRFDEQQNNDLHCVLHYTSSAPWLGGTPGPAQKLFERFATQAGLPVNWQSPAFRKSMRQRLWRNRLAPLRAFAFPLASSVCRFVGRKDKAAAYHQAARYWSDYLRDAPNRRQLHDRRIQEIQMMSFNQVFNSAA